MATICQHSVLGSVQSSSSSKFPFYTPGGAACSREHITQSLRGLAPCQPRDKVIPVPWPNNTDIHQLSPSHVVVRRCSGGCHTRASCVASSRVTRGVQVMMARCPVGGGKCDKECAMLQVQDELECECGCGQGEQEACAARSRSHLWSEESCQCRCRDQGARRDCGERPGSVWDDSSCSCICQGPDTCHTGLEWSELTCACVPSLRLEEAAETSAVVREDRGSQDQSLVYRYLQHHWVETIIIIVLSTTIVILLVTCIALIRRITHLKTMISSTKSSHVKVPPNLYSPCPLSQFESHPNKAERGPPMVSVSPHRMTQASKMPEISSSESELSSEERGTDCSYYTEYTDTSGTLTPPCGCLVTSASPLDSISECSTLLGRTTNV